MTVIESLNTFKQLGSVRVVATSNITGTYFNGPLNNGLRSTFTVAAGAFIVDGVTLLLNDYVLFAGQTDLSQNGIYQVIQVGGSGLSAVLQRRGDFQCLEQMRTGSFIPVNEGSTEAGSMWIVVAPLPAALGFSATGANNININNTSAAGGGGLFLKIANNLSDVASVPASRVNLSVPATSSFAGNPNGNVAGVVGDFVIDTTDGNELWINTTSGTALTAVWQLVSGETPQSWILASSSPTALAPNRGYVTNNGASLLNYTLPTVIPFGSEIQIQGMSSGLFNITQAAGQSINFGDLTTTVGVGGSITSTNANDYIKLLCIVANTTFSVVGGVGNFTVV